MTKKARDLAWEVAARHWRGRANDAQDTCIVLLDAIHDLAVAMYREGVQKRRKPGKELAAACEKTADIVGVADRQAVAWLRERREGGAG